MAYDYSQAGYSQDVLDYINSLDARRNELIGKYAGQNVGLDNPDFLTPQQVQQEASDEIKTQYAPEEVVREYMSRNPLNSENNLNAGVDVRSYGDSRDPSVYDMVRLPFGQDYTFTNKATGETRTFSTPQELGAFAQNINLATGGGNNSANWEVTDPSGQVYAYDSPYTPSFLKQAGQFIADQLPTVIGSMALPGAGGFITAGLGSMAGAGIKGADFWDALKAGAITTGTAALTSFGANQLFPMGTGSPFLDRALSIGNTDTLGFDSFADGISKGFNATSGVGAYGPSTGGVSNVGGIEQALVRPGAFYPGVGALAGVLPAQLATGITNSPSYAGQPGVEEVKVSAKRAPGTDEYGAPFLLPTGLPTPSAGEQWLTSQAAKNAAEPIVGEPAEEPSALDKYLRYASLGLTGASLLGGLVGGGGSGSGTGSSGMVGDSGKMPANFATDKLPTGDAVPAFGGGTSLAARTARPAADFGDVDWNRYGFNPEKSFFPGVPQRAAKGGSMAVARPAKSYAVQGAGDGRSDDIPAVLSDGEYVIDAETVALLGNGSNKAGAAQLDRFRANVRKHKGKELAKGRFSVNAKNPQAYMAGGRK
jgi:hypothetical protein